MDSTEFDSPIRKASKSNGQGACVGVGTRRGEVVVVDLKLDLSQRPLAVTPAAFQKFTVAVKSGEFTSEIALQRSDNEPGRHLPGRRRRPGRGAFHMTGCNTTIPAKKPEISTTAGNRRRQV